uniref:Ubiquitin-like protease family profile domain-containing protein n=1 Tax=Aegilops tauschii subsp. strangulata TaxID=200361 RepID=A0A453AQI0_AEGTS
RIWFQIFIPVHRDVHWCLAIIDMKEETFHYLDSLGGKDSGVLRILARYIMDELKDKNNIEIDTSSWRVVSVHIPLQHNGMGLWYVYAQVHRFLQQRSHTIF